MNLDALFDYVESSQSTLSPSMRLWVRNLRRDRDLGRLPSDLCDLIANAVSATPPDPRSVETVLLSDNADPPVAAARLRRVSDCVERLAHVTTVAAVATYYSSHGYGCSDDEVERCEVDIRSGRLCRENLRGRLRGRLDLAWFTNAELLDALVQAAPSESVANDTCELLGLNFRTGEQLARLDMEARERKHYVIAIPTTVDAAGYPYFLASRDDTDAHGWTLHLRTLERALPEWAIQGLDASMSVTLRCLGTVNAGTPLDWPQLIKRFDDNEI